MKKARRMPCWAICWKHWDGRNISLSILFSSYTVNIRRLDGDRFHSGGNSGEFQFRCNMHFNSVQICFWLQFDSRRLIHMNSNEIPWDALCIQEEDTPCHSYAHNSVSYTDGGYLLSMCMLIAARVSVQTIRMFSHSECTDVRFEAERSVVQKQEKLKCSCGPAHTSQPAIADHITFTCGHAGV